MRGDHPEPGAKRFGLRELVTALRRSGLVRVVGGLAVIGLKLCIEEPWTLKSSMASARLQGPKR